MAFTPQAQLRSAARSTAAPLLNYFNNHFEMTKDEIRRSAAAAVVPDAALDAQMQTGRHLAELSNVVAETQLYQSKLIGDLRREIAALRAEVEQLGSTSSELAAVLTAMTLAPDND